MIDEMFIRKRITYLRELLDISESRMSLDLGHSRSYIHSIAIGRSMPSMAEFLAICEYLDVTPSEFFMEGDISFQKTIRKLNESFLHVDERDLKNIVTPLVKRLEKP